MKNRFRKTVLNIMPLLVLTSISACSNADAFIVDKSLNVVVEKGEHYNLDSNVYKVEQKSDLMFDMNIDDGYYFDSLNYENATITSNNSGVTILLKEICYDLRLKPQIGKYPSVHLIKDDNYSTEKYDFILKDGNELNFKINVNPNKELASCSYSDFDSLNYYDNTADVRLFNINSDVEVSFCFENKEYLDPPSGADPEEAHMYSLMPKGNNKTKCIFYCLNGGKLALNKNEEYGFYKKVDVTRHPRPNTDIGVDSMKREGYQLESWNTKKDGSGTRIGLGSRFTLDYSNIVLYAQWKRENSSTDFTYSTTKNGFAITGFVSSDEYIDEVVVPEYINNTKVTRICKNAFGNYNINSLYLPSNLKDIDEDSFVNCTIENFHFYDSSVFRQNAFKNITIKKIFINAIEKPRYCKIESNCFPDEMDRLILNQDKKKLILYGGCSLSYGIISEEFVKEFPDYTIFNMGIIGGTNSGFQMDCISKYVKEGDLVIHAPESMSEYQLMYSNKAEVRMFNNLESNYDLLTLVDVTKIGDIFEAYYDYCIARRKLDPCKYEDYCDSYNEYGDIKTDLESKIFEEIYRRNEYGRYEYSIIEINYRKYAYQMVNETSVALLEEYYHLFTDRGADVALSFCPIDKDSLGKVELEELSWIKYEDNIKRLLSYPIISSVEDYLFEHKYFFNSCYHMNTFGAYLRTSKLIKDIKQYLGLTN